MKLVIILTLVTMKSFALGVYLCSNNVNPYDKFAKEDSMIAVSNCFYSLSASKAKKTCKADYRALYPKASKKYIRTQVSADRFFSLSECKKLREEIIFDLRETLISEQKFETKKVESRTYSYVK